MPDTTVRYYDVTMSSAPEMLGTAGALIGVLDACLVDGFGSVTLDSLVVAANVATGTVSTGHNFDMILTTGPVIRIEGATPAGLNGDWRVTVTSATQFTFATSGISDQTASGTITAKRAPAGFEKAFTDTNKAAYRSLNAAGNRLYLLIDDTGTTSATATMYEAMSDINTGVNPASVAWRKGTLSPSPWGIFADDRALYLMNDAHGMFFGDIASVLTPDPYGTALIGADYFANFNSTAESYLARAWAGTGGAIAMSRKSIFAGVYNYLGYAGVSFPNPPDSAFHAAPIYALDSTSAIRGTLPGLWNPLHSAAQLLHKGGVPITVNGVARSGMVWKFYNSSYAATFDLTGPWR